VDAPRRSAMKQEGGRRQWNKRVSYAPEVSVSRDDEEPERSAVAGAARGSTLKVVINRRIEAKIDVDTMASRSCISSGILADLRLLTPIASQTLTTAVTFTLGDNSEVTCHEIAYIDTAIQMQMDVIDI
jgi:hypothetical protein